jgi:hypothetical protein
MRSGTAMADEYLALIEDVLDGLTSDTAELAVEIAELPEPVRGYEQTSSRASRVSAPEPRCCARARETGSLLARGRALGRLTRARTCGKLAGALAKIGEQVLDLRVDAAQVIVGRAAQRFEELGAESEEELLALGHGAGERASGFRWKCDGICVEATRGEGAGVEHGCGRVITGQDDHQV